MKFFIVNKNERWYTKGSRKKNTQKGWSLMEAIRSINHQDMANTLDDAMQVLFSKLDDAIDDVENGRVISEEELWKELDAI